MIDLIEILDQFDFHKLVEVDQDEEVNDDQVFEYLMQIVLEINDKRKT
jgi:hypothetical protein